MLAPAAWCERQTTAHDRPLDTAPRLYGMAPRVLLALLGAAWLLIASAPLHAADLRHGKNLHNKHCIACHKSMFGGDGSKMYTRPDRRVNTLSELEAQVRRCDANLGLRWFEDDVDDVVHYLNQTYYHF